MPLKLVTQETLTDCGLACVAMVAGKSLEAVRKVAVKELGYPKDGPYTTTHENLYRLLAHFGIGHGKKTAFKSLPAMPTLAIMETRKMPSTGNSHLVVFERGEDGDEHVLDPGWWLKQQVRRDWNRIKLDTFLPVLLGAEVKKTSKGSEASTKQPPADAMTEGTTAASEPKKAIKPKKTVAKSKPKCTLPTAKPTSPTDQPDAAPTAALADESAGAALVDEPVPAGEAIADVLGADHVD